MKLKIRETIEQEIEVEFPCYASDGSTFLRADKEDNGFANGVFCHYYPNSEHAELQIGTIPKEWLLYPKITPERFNDKINEVLELIKKKL